MRQTSQAAVEQQGLRDVERWKDKIEIRLDNRQVAFLFFGSALIACLLFILGVIVGKRLESRGHAMAPEIEDPLALLDRVASSLPAATAVATRAPSDVAVSRAHAAPANRPPAVTVAAVAPAASKPAKADLDLEVTRPARSQPLVEDVVALSPPPEPLKKTEPAADLTAKAPTTATVARAAAPVAVEPPKAAALTPPKPSTLTVAAAPKPTVPAGAAPCGQPRVAPAVGFCRIGFDRGRPGCGGHCSPSGRAGRPGQEPVHAPGGLVPRARRSRGVCQRIRVGTPRGGHFRRSRQGHLVPGPGG